MVRMKFKSREQARKQYWNLGSFWSFILGALMLGGGSVNWAQEADFGLGEWRVTPRIGVGATYSDNIKLMPDGQTEDDLVLQVDPGISVRKRGGRLDLRLDYTAQGLLYTNNGDANKINNQLQAFGTAEIFQKNFFLDAYGSISQVPINSSSRTDTGNLGATGGIPSGLSLFDNFDLGLPGAAELFNPIGIFSNIALTDNQTTAYRFGVSPYWQQDVGGWVKVLLRYRYDDIFYDEQNGIDNQQEGQQINDNSDNSDSQINTINFNLASGRQFSTLKWNIGYFYQQQKQDNLTNNNTGDNGDDRQENLTGELTYRLSNHWSLLAEAGYEDNQVADFENSRNGGYWGLGAIWSPSRFMELKGLYGSDVNEIALRWNPSLRTHLQISRRDQSVGVDPGVHWEGSFGHRTANITWSARYTDEVTNEQQLLGRSVLGSSGDGQSQSPDEQNQPVVSEGPFGLTNQNFRRKRFDGSVTYRHGPTGLSVSAFNENRENQDAVSQENTYGAGALWTWRFAPRTASFIGTGWEHDDLGENQSDENQQNDYWVSVIGLARVFTPDFGGLVSYRLYQNNSNSTEQEFRENRLNIRFNMKF